MAYPGIMIMLDSAAGEIVDSGNTGYDWYSYWSSNNYNLGPTAATSYVPWRTFYMFVKAANDVIGAVDTETATDLQLQLLGMAYAYRAFTYLNMVRIYEWKAPTDPAVKSTYTPESDIKGLAVPIITEDTDLEAAKNNPRATVDAVYELIFSDLDKAEEYLADYTSTSTTYPSLAVVYGLKARAYLERGSAGVSGAFASAASYARKALDTFGGSPLTQAQWENPQTGFNSSSANANSWMWSLSYSAETMGNLCNFVNHMSPECTWSSYAWAVGRGIAKNLYDKIPDTDWRKHSWIDPAGLDYYAYKTNRNVFDEDNKPLGAYSNLKFHPANGDYATYKVGGATEVPLMRMEEMMLIEAEALAMSGDIAGGKAVLTQLMLTRNPAYSCEAITTADKFQSEVYFQKRVELWGEGLIYFDAKRLGAGITNGYAGTNAQDGYRYNVKGVAPWWNWVIPQRELEGNPALQGHNNPDPTKTVDPWTE
ncbi:MAG: RagB/SusD family nutrient uptake outer membrane protein [Bacteroidales bacterium]|nr:RagB/SusD family nutrient uptake outer membrane protein [Bacteroidales bacterium]